MRGEGFGKIILFGEHFVVYGEKAIAIPLSLKTVVEIEEGEWNFSGDLLKAFKAVLNKMGIEKSYRVEVLETVPIKKNLGSSAAILAAFAKAVNKKEGLNLSLKEINKAVYEGEKVMHGNPSGIDNTVAVYGKPIVFKKTEKGNIITPIEKESVFHFLIVDSGHKILTTKEAVELFRKNKESSSSSPFLFKAYSTLIEEALESIKNGRNKKLGLLMDINNGLLSSLGVSSKNIEELRYLTKSLGALGAKLSGAGTGGNIIALFENEEKAKEAKQVLTNYGYPSFYTTF